MGKRKAKCSEENWYNARVGQQIEAARRRSGIAQKTLARKLGISPSQLNHYECGEHRCPPYLLRLISVELTIAIELLLPRAKE